MGCLLLWNSQVTYTCAHTNLDQAQMESLHHMGSQHRKLRHRSSTVKPIIDNRVHTDGYGNTSESYTHMFHHERFNMTVGHAYLPLRQIFAPLSHTPGEESRRIPYATFAFLAQFPDTLGCCLVVDLLQELQLQPSCLVDLELVQHLHPNCWQSRFHRLLLLHV